MYRVMRMSGTVYAAKFDISSALEIENIIGFIKQGDPVLLVDDVFEAADFFDVDEEDIEMVD